MTDESIIGGEIPSDVETEYYIHTISDDLDDLYYGLHSKGRAYINHYSKIKLKYKKLSFTWFSAFLIALFSITAHNFSEEVGIDKLYLISLVTILAILGVRRLRFLDVEIYHSQMREIFIEMLQIESKCEILAAEYTSMARLLHGKFKDPVISDAFYYAIIEFSMATIGILSLYLKMSINHPLLGLSISFGILFIIAALECYTVISSVRHGASRR